MILFNNLVSAQKADFIRTKPVYDQNVIDARLKVSHSFQLPLLNNSTLNGAKSMPGYLLYNTTERNIAFYDGQNWLPVSNSVIGEIRLFAGTIPPFGWMICNGQQLDKGVYPEIFEKIKYTFHFSNTGRFFKLPDLMTSAPVPAQRQPTPSGSNYTNEIGQVTIGPLINYIIYVGK